jgi:hypothetical protein
MLTFDRPLHDNSLFVISNVRKKNYGGKKFITSSLYRQMLRSYMVMPRICYTYIGSTVNILLFL